MHCEFPQGKYSLIFLPENRMRLKLKAQIFNLRQILKQDAPN
jgi:hypothetical protein